MELSFKNWKTDFINSIFEFFVLTFKLIFSYLPFSNLSIQNTNSRCVCSEKIKRKKKLLTIYRNAMLYTTLKN
jgi:hypothetical protein